MELEQTTEIAISTHTQKLGNLALSLGYEGTLTLGAIEDEIRFYQQRTVEACMELGKRLLIMKEMTPHGEFTKRIEMLGISKRTAQRFMSVVLKFSKTTSMSLLEKSGNGTKLLELMVLDDDDIEIIADWPEDFALFSRSLIVSAGRCLTLPPLKMQLWIEETNAHVPSQQPHNALADARALKLSYLNAMTL